MATDYMTILMADIGDLEPRLWRLKQAIEVPDPNFLVSDIEKELMQERYEATLRLYRVLVAQHELFCMEKEECDAIKNTYGSASRFVDSIEHEPDYSSMQNAYEKELSMLDSTNRFIDHKWMSITRPQDSIYKDYPQELKDELHREADQVLKKTMSPKKYRELKKDAEADYAMDYFQRFERKLSSVLTKQALKKAVASEKRYYRDLDKWNRKGGL